MNSDNSGNQHSQTNPQSTNGAAQADDNAPVFVSSVKDLIEHTRPMQEGFFRRFNQYGLFACASLAILYALALTFAEGQFPQFYRAWLDFFMPLAQFIGDLTPRADRITGQLVENGYPERVDIASHGIAMAKIFAVMVLVYILVATFFAAHRSPVFISCTSGTRIKMRLRLLCSRVVIVMLMVSCVYLVEFYDSEKFGDDFEELGAIAKSGQYHHSNLAMLKDWIAFMAGLLVFMIGTWSVAIMSCVRLTIVKQPPENKV